jgi:DNA-binding transcriptional LysR family regulator
LLDRSNHVVKLTSVGRSFLTYARRILRLSESAALHTRRATAGEVGTITLGFTAGSGYSFLPQLINLCILRLPQLDIVLKEMPTIDQKVALLADSIDAGLMRPPIDSMEFSRMRIVSESMVAALPAGDRRLLKDTLTLSDLDGQPFIGYAQEGASYFHGLLTGLFDANNISPNYVQLLTHIHSILALVRSGLGAALVPETAANLRFEGVQFRPVVTTPAAPLELYMVWRSNTDNPALLPLINLVRHTYCQKSHRLNGHMDPEKFLIE